MFDLVCCQAPVFLLLRRGPELLVEGVGQEGEDCEGREGLADDLNETEGLAGTYRPTENTHSQTGAHLRQFVLNNPLDISSVRSSLVNFDED